jgi:lipopolysaccharide transport system permease protein
MLMIYVLVFGLMFKVRWEQGGDNWHSSILALFVGLIVFNFFSECTNRSASLVLENRNYVKKVVFPLEILPLVCLAESFFLITVNLIVFFIAHIFLLGIPPLTIFMLPLAILPLFFLTAGLSWFISAIGVYFRDLSQIIVLFNLGLMFISTVFFPDSVYPDELRFLLRINPIAISINEFRDILIWGIIPSHEEYLLLVTLSFLFAVLGFKFFMAAKRGFADVI